MLSWSEDVCARCREENQAIEEARSTAVLGMWRVWIWSANDAQAPVPDNGFGCCAGSIKDLELSALWIGKSSASITVLLREPDDGKVVEIYRCGEKDFKFPPLRFLTVRNELAESTENDQRGTGKRWDTATNDHSLDAPGMAAAGG